MKIFHKITVLFLVAIIASSANSEDIQNSVGEGGTDNDGDVLIVQILLNQIPSSEGGPQNLLVPDGLNGPNTIRAIKGFQTKHFGAANADGRVDPGQRTLQKLNSVVDSQSLNHRIARIAQGERLFWRDGTRKERDNIVSTRLQKYWKAVNLSVTVDQIRDETFQSGHPWSAAFVSWVMKKAGASDKFKYTAAHWQYTADAKGNRIYGNSNPFMAYRVDEKAVTPGDIVVKRRGSSMATYDNIEDGHITHGDIVIAVNNGKAETIGGNVGNSVKTTDVDVNTNKKVNQTGYFAVVKVN